MAVSKKVKSLKQVFVPGPGMMPQDFNSPSFAMPPGMGQQPGVNPTQEELNMSVEPAPQMDIPTPEVAAVPYGSGRTNKQQIQGKQDVLKQSVRNTMLTPEEVNQLAETYRQLPEYQNEKRGLNQIEDLLMSKAGAMEPQIDLTPLMALSDAWTGSKFAGSYKKPADQSNFLTEQLGKLQTGRKDMAKGITDFIKASKSGVETEKLLQSLGVMGLAQAVDPKPKFNPVTAQNADRAASENVIKAATKLQGDAGKARDTFDMIDNLLDKPSVQSLGIASTRIAKGLAGDVGNIAVQEAERNSPHTLGMLLSRAEAFINNNPGQPIDPQITQEIKSIVNRARVITRKRLKDQASSTKQSYMSAKGFDKENVSQIYSPLESYIETIGGKEEAAAGPAKNEPSLRDILNELKSQAGKK
jgi:hypothetical protein